MALSLERRRSALLRTITCAFPGCGRAGLTLRQGKSALCETRLGVHDDFSRLCETRHPFLTKEIGDAIWALHVVSRLHSVQPTRQRAASAVSAGAGVGSAPSQELQPEAPGPHCLQHPLRYYASPSAPQPDLSPPSTIYAFRSSRAPPPTLLPRSGSSALASPPPLISASVWSRGGVVNTPPLYFALDLRFLGIDTCAS